MSEQTYTVDVLVVGGGTGGASAAIQAARAGAKTMLVSEFPWLGGMLTSAGVSAPDGNELEAFQTGLWGEFLQQLQQRQPEGLDNCWVSFFSYHPRVGAEIFADWVRQLPNLDWIWGQLPLEVRRQGNCVTAVRFANFTVYAKIILDGTELGDLLALAEVSFRWGWELQSQWQEPSAPVTFNSLTAKYPVQAPTWVVVMQEHGATKGMAPEIKAAPDYDPSLFAGAWDNYGAEAFLNYGRLPGGLFMINWPFNGNDYGQQLTRLIESKAAWREFQLECRYHSQNFARFIQTQCDRPLGLAHNVFPLCWEETGAFALHPYYRESRRLVGLTTVTEWDILPMTSGRVAVLPEDAIAIGNYVNDHHYPGVKFELQPKSLRWGGRQTGTPFAIPYRCLVPADTDGLLVCEKNISVSHIANGATRLQPVVMNIGQAAGMAAAICAQLDCQPRDLPVKVLQKALLQQQRSPAAIVPLFNLPPDRPDWLYWQLYYLERPDTYPASGDCPGVLPFSGKIKFRHNLQCFSGILHVLAPQNYSFTILEPALYKGQTWQLVTLRAHVNEQLQNYLADKQSLKLWGRLNHAGNWLIAESLDA